MTEHPEYIARLIAACRQYPGLDPRDVLEAIDDPQWNDASRTNDWRNYVNSQVRCDWHQLPRPARLVAYLMSASRSFSE